MIDRKIMTSVKISRRTDGKPELVSSRGKRRTLRGTNAKIINGIGDLSGGRYLRLVLDVPEVLKSRTPENFVFGFIDLLDFLKIRNFGNIKNR